MRWLVGFIIKTFAGLMFMYGGIYSVSNASMIYPFICFVFGYLFIEIYHKYLVYVENYNQIVNYKQIKEDN